MKGKLLRSALLASAAVLISTGGGLVLSSCIEIGKNEASSGGEVKKEDLYAVVQGVVKDDTGKPVAGAKVTIGNLSTTTNEAGYYQFDKVPVTAVYGDDDLDNTPTYQDIVIVIKAPEGSNLADTVMVTAKPVAQHFDSSHNDETGTAISNPNTVLTQLLAQAKTAVMPHKGAVLHGVLRNPSTGEPIANALIKFYEPKTPGCEYPGCQIQVDPVVVTTGEDGSFTVEGLLTNSTYDIEVAGYNVSPSSVSTPAPSSGETAFVRNIGNLYATPVVAADSIPPKIVVNPARYGGKVIGLMGTDLAQLSIPGGDFTGLLVLAPGVDGANEPIPVMFTEKMNTSIPLTPNQSVVVYDETAKQVVDVANLAWDADGKTLLITTSSAIPAGHDIYVRLRGYEFQDLAGNALQVNPGNPPTNVISTASVSDPLVEGPKGNKEDYVQIQYEIYDPTTAVVDPVNDLVQLDVPGADSNTADDDPTPVYSVDTAFENHKAFYDVDEDNTNPTIAQLNDPSINATTDDLICQLGNALNSSINNTDCINNNQTKLAFTPVAGVNKYRVKLNDTAYPADIDITTLSTNFSSIAPGLEARLNGGKVELRLTGVTVGDVVHVISLNGFGDEAIAASVELEDTVPPFTVVQNVPGSLNRVDVFGGAPSAGQGGNLVDIGTSAGGTGLPFFYIRADMYSKTASKVDDWTQLDIGSDGYYNKNNFADLIGSPRTLGIWVSEPLDSVSVKLLQGTSDVTGTLLTGTPNFIGSVGGFPLAAFQVNDILEAQKLTRISLAGSTDAQGNVAGSEADLVVKDNMPPMLQEAYADPANPNRLILKFSEDVQLFDYDAFGNPIGINNVITIGAFTFNTDSSGNVSTFPAGAVNWYTDQNGRTLDPAQTTISATVSGNTVTIEVTGKDSGGNDVDTSKFWEELIWAWNTNTEGDYHAVHGAIDFHNVPDVHGNDWNDSADDWTTLPPLFVAEDKLYPRIAAGANPIDDATTPLKLDITDGAGNVHNQDAASGGVGGPANDGNWYVGDNTGGETFNLRIKFREKLADMDNDGDFDKDDLAAMAAGATFVSGGANYTFPAQDYGNAGDGAKIDAIDDYTIEIHFDLRAGQTVTAGDEIKITNLKDDAGNTIPDFTIKLNAAGEGITVTNVAY